MSDAELLDIENHACPGAGACGGQFTANTMATVMELIGLSPMGTAAVPQVDMRKDDVAYRCGEVIMNAVRKNIRPRDICTRTAFDNAIAGVAATGGSTNAVLHLLAMAREAEVPLTIDDFEPICARTPVFVDLKPGGKYHGRGRGQGGRHRRDRAAPGGRQYVDGSAHDRHRPHVRRRGRGGEGNAGPGSDPAARSSRSSRAAASRFCAARWRPKAA